MVESVRDMYIEKITYFPSFSLKHLHHIKVIKSDGVGGRVDFDGVDVAVNFATEYEFETKSKDILDRKIE